MNTLKTRIVSVLLVVAVVCGMVCISPVASAAYQYSPQPTFWSSVRKSIGDAALSFLGISFDYSVFDFTFSETGSVTPTKLKKIMDEYNSFIGRAQRTILNSGIGDVAQWADLPALSPFTSAEMSQDYDYGIVRLRDTTTGKWLVDRYGGFPYYEVDTTNSALQKNTYVQITNMTNPAPEVNKTTSNKWCNRQDVLAGFDTINTMYGYDSLKAHADSLNRNNTKGSFVYDVALFSGDFYGLRRRGATSQGFGSDYWLCDSYGHPYMTVKNKEQSAVNQVQNYIKQDDNGNAIIVNGNVQTQDAPLIDQSNQEFNIPVDNSTSNTFQIDSINFNTDNRSYTLETHQDTYNTDNRRYETNYYTWNITYNITNTYVTYIGSNDAYQQKEYEFYYELPDGRSSADLTADEVAAMSFQFADVMNYNRSATDTNLRALYHFDGDLSDSGYFSDKTAFTWQSGASITYMDSSVFDGALYLDETKHEFDITLSTALTSSSDFSIQWRYYQASVADTVDNIENFLSLNDQIVLRWDERSLYNSAKTKLCALPVGNWVELALIRHNGVLRLYLNGIAVSTLSSPGSVRQLSFYLGSTSRAYSMLDELRVIDFVLATDGVSYTPSAVPHDSNLVLVLPGTESVVDEYWEYTSPNNLFERPLFTDGGDYISFTATDDVGAWGFSSSSPNTLAYSLDDSCLTLSGGSSPSYSIGRYSTFRATGFYYALRDARSSATYYAPGFKNSSDSFTFSIVTPDGTVYSLPFKFLDKETIATFDWGALVYKRGYGSDDKPDYSLFIAPAAGKSVSIAYMELVAGSSPQVVATKVTSVFDLSTLKPNTAAVQTDIPIHGYTVGGVRPTFPTRGDVWFGVTNGRVSSVQVYTGSAWTSANARWWTGERWIPIYAFDIFTLEDCWDIADGDDVITPIESDTAGWNWWKKAWTDFRSWLAGIFVGGGSNGDDDPDSSSNPSASPGTPSNAPGTNPGDDYDDGEPDVLDDPLEDEHGKKVSIFSLAKWIGKGIWKLIKGLFKVVFGGVIGLFKAIFNGISDFFDVFDSGLLHQKKGVFGFYNYWGFDIWD